MADIERPLRRGLPRPGEEPSRPGEPSRQGSGAAPGSVPTTEAARERRGLPTRNDVPTPAAEAPAPRPVQAASTTPAPPRFLRRTRRQWAIGGLVVVGIPLLLAIVVLSARSLVSLPAVQDFLTDHPGEYPLPEAAPVGFPVWLGWQHFLNAFLMLLIIRSGLQIRHERRPAAYWSPRWNRSRKISLTIWFHQALDILWLLNGAVFVVLLFTTGQWMRIVPTSWEVFPNAVSAALLYLSLDWPTENGWVNYNSLQQLAYATTVFVAAPLAAVTGLRMSGLWPQRAQWLNAVFPIGWARAIHYPSMVYFVIFIITHVTLVLSNGALRNLNHMYALRGDDSNAHADNWTGFFIFAVSAVIMAGGWFAARPFVLAPVARLFGTVSSR